MFVLAPDGVIKMCTLNYPGTWHDSQRISEYAGVYKQIGEVYNLSTMLRLSRTEGFYFYKGNCLSETADNVFTSLITGMTCNL